MTQHGPRHITPFLLRTSTNTQFLQSITNNDDVPHKMKLFLSGDFPEWTAIYHQGVSPVTGEEDEEGMSPSFLKP